MRNPYSGISFVRVEGLRAHALPLSLNILMLYDNMEQLAKFCMSIYTLLAWFDCSSEFIITNIEKCLNIIRVF